MGFAKVFDKDSRTISLINLLDTALKSRRESPNEELVQRLTYEEVIKLKEELLTHKVTLKKIKDLRDQHLAHLDKNPKENNLPTKGEIDNLSKTIDTIFNKLSSSHDGNIYSWSFQEDSSSRTTINVLNTLKDEIARQKAKSKRLIRKTRS